MGLIDRIYKGSPVLLQNAIVSAYGYYWKWTRLGGKYQRDCEILKSRETWNAEQWQIYSEQQLRSLLQISFNVPYYRKLWSDIGLSEYDARTFKLENLASLPALEKSAARDYPHDLLVSGKPKRSYLVIHTSGSTGTPVKTYRTLGERRLGFAFRDRSCRFANISYQLPRATFGGRIIVSDSESTGPFHRYNHAEKQVYLSAFHLRPENASQYVNALNKHKIRWFTGYGYSIYELASMIIEQNLHAPRLEAVITTSEKITPFMRATIEEAFSTKVFEEYGAVEDAFYVCECEHGSKHINPDAGILEVVDENLRPVEPGQEGEVIGTGFIRLVQPLIRYRIGDRAILSATPCTCGRAMPVLHEVIGRLEDTVYGPDGRRMVRFHGIFTDQPSIIEGQIIQESLNHIRVRIVPKPSFSDSDRANITHRIQQRLTSNVNVTIEIVPTIERTSKGKFRAVISNLSEEELKKVKS